MNNFATKNNAKRLLSEIRLAGAFVDVASRELLQLLINVDGDLEHEQPRKVEEVKELIEGLTDSTIELISKVDRFNIHFKEIIFNTLTEYNGRAKQIIEEINNNQEENWK